MTKSEAAIVLARAEGVRESLARLNFPKEVMPQRTFAEMVDALDDLIMMARAELTAVDGVEETP